MGGGGGGGVVGGDKGSASLVSIPQNLQLFNRELHVQNILFKWLQQLKAFCVAYILLDFFKYKNICCVW